MDVAAMAERLSAAASSASNAGSTSDTSTATTTDPTPVVSTPDTSTSAATPEPAQALSAADPNAQPDLQFEDDEPEIDFDAPVTPAATATPATTTAAATAAATTAESTVPATPGSEFDNLLPKAVETAFLKTNRGRNLLATYKSERVLKEPPSFDPATGENTGGLGYMPTPDQIKEYHARASDLEAMQHEFTQNPESWAINHFGVGADGNLREGAVRTLSTLPGVINDAYERAVRENNPQLQEQAVTAFKAVFQPMAMEYINGLYDRARQIQDPAKREQYLNGARTIEFDLTGKFRDDAQLAPPKPEDALVQQRRELEAEKQQLLSWRQKNQSEAVTQVRNALFASIDQSVTKDIERAFATAGLDKSMKPFALKAAVDAYKTQVQQGVKQNQFAFRQYNFALSKLGPNSTAEQRQEVAKIYQQSARQVIKSSYRNILKDLVDGTVSQNAATRTTAAAAATQTAPRVNGGQPPAQALVPGERLQRQPGEDRSDYIQRQLQHSLQSNGTAAGAPRR